MCLSLAGLEGRKGRYNGCDWEMANVLLFRRRPRTWKAGRLAHLLCFCSCPFLRSGPLANARVEGIKLLLSEEALAGRYTKDTCCHLLTPGGPSPAGTLGSRGSVGWGVVGSRSLVTSAPGTGSFLRKSQRKCLLQHRPGSHRAHGTDILLPRGLAVKDLLQTGIQYLFKMQVYRKFS